MSEGGRGDFDSQGPLTLARAYVWSELRGQGWKLFAFPLVAGVVVAAGIAVAALTSPRLDTDTVALLETAAALYFTSVPDDGALLTALIVAQGPSTVGMLAAVTSLVLVQSGLGKRLAVGEFELLLSGPYRDRDVFVALVLGAFALSLLGIAILLVLTSGVGLAVLLSSGVQLSPAGVTLFAVGAVAPIPMALWATFVAVVIYLLFPEAATNNSHPANLLAMVAILPAIAVLLATTAGAVDAALLVALANLVPLSGIALGWVSVRYWFDVKRLL